MPACLCEARCVRLVYELLKGWHGEQVGELVVTDLAATRQHLEELGLCHARQQMLHEDEDLLSQCLGHVQVHLELGRDPSHHVHRQVPEGVLRGDEEEGLRRSLGHEEELRPRAEILTSAPTA